ncbi:MAG: hypothetical protein HY093_02950, partial [Candidatus Liptonbacteria bacterium]|nr:hypothetical protein [Candidatus Liptonbacteria bacterium]
MKLNSKAFFCVALAASLVFVLSIFFVKSAQAAVSSTPVIPYQGRLEDPSGNLFSGSFDFKFSIWTTSTVSQGTRIWPTAAPASTTFQVSNGVFDVRLGDTSQGFTGIDFTTTTSTALYLQVEVYNSSTAAFETLSPRQIIISTALAINGTGVNNLIQFDSSGGIIVPNGTSTFSGNLVVSGVTTLSGLNFTNATGTGNLQVATLTVTGATSLQNLSFVNATGSSSFALTGTPPVSTSSQLFQLGPNSIQLSNATTTYLGANIATGFGGN